MVTDTRQYKIKQRETYSLPYHNYTSTHKAFEIKYNTQIIISIWGHSFLLNKYIHLMKISISSSHALLKRSISGIAYVSLILLALLLKNGIFFFILFSFFAICAVIEYNMMSGISRKRPFRVAIDACAVVWVFLMGYLINSRTYTLAVWVPLVAYLFIFLPEVFSLMRAMKSHHLQFCFPPCLHRITFLLLRL